MSIHYRNLVTASQSRIPRMIKMKKKKMQEKLHLQRKPNRRKKTEIFLVKKIIQTVQRKIS